MRSCWQENTAAWTYNSVSKGGQTRGEKREFGKNSSNMGKMGEQMLVWGRLKTGKADVVSHTEQQMRQEIRNDRLREAEYEKHGAGLCITAQKKKKKEMFAPGKREPGRDFSEKKSVLVLWG